jgi:hypothetical protein
LWIPKGKIIDIPLCAITILQNDPDSVGNLSTLGGGMKMKANRLARLALAAGTLLVLAGPAPAAPAWYGGSGFNPGVVDFYQHQNWVPGAANTWEAGGGWCFWTAYSDVFYDLTNQGYQGLFNTDPTTANSWYDAMYGATNAKADVQGSNIAQLVKNMPNESEVQDFLNTVNQTNKIAMNGKGELVSNTFTVRSTGMIKEAPTLSAFDLINEKIKAGDEVLIKIVKGSADTTTTTAAGQNLWWAAKNTFHFLAVAGINTTLANKTVYIADPDSNNGSTLDFGGWPQANANFPGDPPAVGGGSLGLRTPSNAALPKPANPNNGNAASFNAFFTDFTLSNKDVVASSVSPQYNGALLDVISTVGPSPVGLASVTPQAGGKDETVLTLASGTNTIDQVFVAPTAGTLDPNTDGGLFSMSSPGSSWSDMLATQDPFNNPLPDDGVDYTLNSGSGLAPGQTATIDLGTLGDFSTGGYEVLLHFAGDPSNLWDPETINGTIDNSSDTAAYQVVPEPSSCALLAIATCGLLTRRRSCRVRPETL